MKKEELVELGLDDEQIRGVFKINGLDIENVNVKVTDLESKVEALEEDKRVLSEDLGAITKSNEDIAALEAEKIALTEELETVKLTHQEELDNLSYTNLVDSLLKDAGAKNLDLAKSVLNKEVIKLNEGKLDGGEEEITRLKTEYDYLFGGPSKPKFTAPSSDDSSNSGDIFSKTVNKIIGK